MSLSNKSYPGLMFEEAKRLRQLNNLLQSLGGRHDMLTVNEKRDLKSYLIKTQSAQGVFMPERS